MANEYVYNGVPFLRSQDIQPFHIADGGSKFITPEFHAKLKKSELRAGDVVIVRTGFPGTAAVVPQRLDRSNCADLVIATPGPGLNPWFLTCLLNSAWGKGAVSGVLVGVAQQHFNVGAAKEMRFRCPPVPVQDRIADILSAYDDLIENNKRRIAILEDTVRRLFDEWFGRKTEGGEADSVRIDSLIELDPKTKVPKEGLKAFLPMPCVPTNSMVVSEWEEREGNAGSKFLNGDTLLARITPCLENGKTAFVDFLPEGEAGFGSTEFIVMRGRSVPPEFVYCLARSDAFREHAIKSMSGATGRQRVSSAAVAQFEISQPDAEQLCKFGDAARSMFAMVRSLADAKTNLRITRDLLLPKLISGEVDVRASEEALEAAAA